MKIGLDIMGGDFAPAEAIKGVKLFLESSMSDNVQLALIGNKALIEPSLTEACIDPLKYQLINADQVIGMNEPPTRALKEKQGSSIAIGFHLLGNKQIDAFISAGNTGAMMVGALYNIKAMEGIQRPTISTMVPKEDGSTGLLLDVGINADCKPENLLQFAILGTLYAKNILKIKDPKVGLMNIGEEEGKGNLLAQAAYPILKNSPKIKFVGNIEGRDLFSNKAEVIVCDGFTGNIILKLCESLYDIILKRKVNDEYFELFNFERYGGTPVLGVAEPVIIGHGISKALAFKNMINLAQDMIETKLLEKIKASFVTEKVPD